MMIPLLTLFCYQLGDDHVDRSQLEREIEGLVQVVAQGDVGVTRATESEARAKILSTRTRVGRPGR